MERISSRMNNIKATMGRIMSAGYCLAFLLPVVGLADTTTVLALTPRSLHSSDGRRKVTGQWQYHRGDDPFWTHHDSYDSDGKIIECGLCRTAMVPFRWNGLPHNRGSGQADVTNNERSLPQADFQNLNMLSPFRPRLPMAMVICGVPAFDSGYAGLSGRSALFYSQNDDVSASQDSDSSKAKGRVFRDLGCAVKITLSDIKHVYTSPARMNTRHALWLGGILGVGGVIFHYDQEIYDALKRNEYHRYYRPVRDVGEFFEPLGYMGFMNKYLFGALAMGYIAHIEPMVEIPFDILEHFLVASAGKNLIMVLAGRKGPMIKEGPRRFKLSDDRSFPSGHSLTIMQLASVLSYHIDHVPFKVAAYGVAGTVLLQRITSDHHWPSDVYAGAVYGWVVSHELLRLKKNRKIRITPTTLNEGKGPGLAVTFGF